MAKLELGEPLLPDSRLSGIAARLVMEFPKLSDSDFVTWIQEPKEMVGENGLVTRLPEVAVFAIVTGTKMTKAAAYLNQFEQDNNYDDSTAMNIFRAVAREHLRVLESLEGMIDGKDRTIQWSNVRME